MVVETERRRALLFELMALISFFILPAAVRGFEGSAPRAWVFWRVGYGDLLASLGEIILLLFIVWNSGDEYQTFGIKKPILADFGIGIGMFLALFACFQLPRLLTPDEMHKFLSSYVGTAGIVRLAISLVIASVAEEIMCRGIFIPRISELIGNEWAGVALSAGLFAIGHSYQGTLGMLGACAMGLLFGISFIFTKSLTPGIIAHVLVNLAIIFR